MRRVPLLILLMLGCACQRKTAPAAGGVLDAAGAAEAAAPRAKTPAPSLSADQKPCLDSPKRPAVDVRDGNIVFCPRQGPHRELTHTGIDFSPSLSADATRVVFVRSKTESPKVGELWDSGIVLVDVASGREREIARNSGETFDPCRSLDNPVFGFDDLIMVEALGHNIPHFAHRAVCAIDLRSDPPKVGNIGPGADCVTAIDSGTERGHFFVRGRFRSASNPAAGYARIVARSGRRVSELGLDIDDDHYAGVRIGPSCSAK